MSTDDNIGPEKPGEEGGVEADRIRAEVEQTRAELAETIDAIQDRLNPKNVVARAADSVRQATVGKVKTMVDSAIGSSGGRGYADDLMDMARQHPVPLAMIGAGVTWLLLRNRGGGSYRSGAYYDVDAYPTGEYDEGAGYEEYRDDGAYTSVTTWETTGASSSAYPALFAAALAGFGWWAAKTMSEQRPYAGYGEGRGRSAMRRAKQSVSDAASKTQEAVGEVAEDVQHRASEMADAVQHRAGEMADAVKSRASAMAERARYATTRAGMRSRQVVNQNPLAMAAVAAAVGVAVGFATPITEAENEYLGEARDSVVGQAQQAASRAMERVQEVADNVVQNM